MKLKAMTFNEEIYPNTISVELTIEELIWIGLAAGKLRDRDKPRNFNLYRPCSDIINRFWESGFSEAASTLNVPMILNNPKCE
jgi:hypothetical protein